MDDYTSEVIKIPLSQQGKYAGQFEATVSIEDKDLAELNWNVQIIHNSNLRYSRRMKRGADGKQKPILLHRVIMERMLGDKPIPDGLQVDHKDGNPLNNCRDNLRLATRHENMRNSRKQVNNTSGYKGVFWNKRSKKWQSCISVAGKNIHLGTFDTPDLAYKAYCKAAEKYHGDFANNGEN